MRHDWQRVLPGTIPQSLTRSGTKRFFFAQETYFRECWRALEEVWADEAETMLQRVGFVLCKPDAIVTRAVEPCVRALADEGFVAFHAAPLRLTRHAMRELWRYHLNLASLQRLDAIDLLLGACDSLLVFVLDGRRGPSACERIAQLKGPAFPTAARPRLPHHLRVRIGAGPGLLNHIHTPDEPADFVRELGVLCDADEWTRMATAARDRSRAAPVGELARALYAKSPAHDLDVAATLARIEDACRGTVEDDIVVEAVQRARAGLAQDWRAAVARMRTIGVASWDAIVFAAACTRSDVAGVKPFLEWEELPRLDEDSLRLDAAP